MTDPRERDALADRRQSIVILRLVASGGRLLYGEVVDVEAGPHGRFAGWHGLTAAVRAWFAEQGGSEAAADELVVAEAPAMETEECRPRDPGPEMPDRPSRPRRPVA